MVFGQQLKPISVSQFMSLQVVKECSLFCTGRHGAKPLGPAEQHRLLLQRRNIMEATPNAQFQRPHLRRARIMTVAKISFLLRSLRRRADEYSEQCVHRARERSDELPAPLALRCSVAELAQRGDGLSLSRWMKAGSWCRRRPEGRGRLHRWSTSAAWTQRWLLRGGARSRSR